MKSFPLRACKVSVIRRELARYPATDAHLMQLAARIAVHPYSAVLVSGGAVASGLENRYSMIAYDPFLSFISKGQSCRIEAAGWSQVLHGDPLRLLDAACALFQPDFSLCVPPFAGGAVGYFAYDLKNVVEKLPTTAVDDLNLPDIFLFWPRRLLVHDRVRKRLVHLVFKYEPEDVSSAGGSEGVASDTDGFGAGPEAPLLFDEPDVPLAESAKTIDCRLDDLRSNFTHQDYLRAVSEVRRYIEAGDVYQVNLSQRFYLPLAGNPFELWSALFRLNPTPFHAYIQAVDHQVLSTSMERFLFRRGDYIETRPIKGTRKRGSTAEEDRLLREELCRSGKDDAELAMIVDLLRNDLGRVCRARSIRVLAHKRLESYQSVHHLVSIISGRLKEGISNGEVLRATFPGGSITGCPKIRAMEIIDELEPNVRHIYTGSIGYLGWHANMDLNIAIRTALIKDGVCYYSAGGGIVYDSTAEDEYRETLHKARSLFQVIDKLGRHPW